MSVRNSFVLLLFLFIGPNLASQTPSRLIGVGTLNGGSIFSINQDGTDAQQLVNMTIAENPSCSLLPVNNRLWGTTTSGGDNGAGVIFSMEIDGTDFRIQHHFDGTTGKAPYGSLSISNGKIWGTTYNGGNTDDGVIFSINPDGSNFTKVHDFDGTQGAKPTSALVELNGKLYGSTSSGGTSNMGILFSIDQQGSNFSVIHEFDFYDFDSGLEPLGELIVIDGKLFGTAKNGGYYGFGLIYSFDIAEGAYSVIHAFDDTSGSHPESGFLYFDNKLWGTTTGGGASGKGVIYSIKTNGSELTILHDMDDSNGYQALGSLIFNNGRLWGINYRGGENGLGVLFSLEEDGSNYTKHQDFDFYNGRSPERGLVHYNNKLWGTTHYGGTSGNGIIYSVDNSGQNFQVVYNFDNVIGTSPAGGFIEEDGKLWSMTTTGGTYGHGLIFSINVDGTNYSPVHHFDSLQGRRPYGRLIKVGDSFLGMTRSGGQYDQGLIFSTNLDGSNFNVVYEFQESTGSLPYGTLIEADGKFYGMTQNGGDHDYGVIFQINTDGTGYSVLFDFDHFTTGSRPRGSLTMAGGRLWGVTRYGGSNFSGTLFSLKDDGTDFTIHVHFDGTSGALPNTDLIIHDDKLWGLSGPIFTIDLDGSNFTIVHNFTQEDGMGPVRSLIKSNGKFWGQTNSEGAGFGTIFSLELDGTNFQKVFNLTEDIGGQAKGGPLFAIDNTGPVLKSETEVMLAEQTTDFIYTIHTNEAGDLSMGTTKDENLFNLSGNEISFKTVPDFEAPADGNGDNQYLLDVIAEDVLGNQLTTELTISVSDLDEIPPNFTSANSTSYIENSTSSVYTATANEPVNFTLGNSKDEAMFTIAAGVVNFASPPDYENSGDFDNNNEYLLDLIAIDANGNSSALELAVIVTDEEDTGSASTKFFGLGSDNGGSVYMVDVDGSNLTELVNFEIPKNPQGRLLAYDNKLWGMASRGGDFNGGTIFSMNPDGSEYNDVHQFQDATGRLPEGSLLKVGDKFWGIARTGGNFSGGVLFTIDLDGTNYNPIHHFKLEDGNQPNGDLMQLNGKIWGTTFFGGDAFTGVIYNINTDGTGFTKVREFEYQSGSNPNSDLITHGNKIWGMTTSGGNHDHGVIFSIDADGNNYVARHHFDGINGNFPKGELTVSNNKIWGMTSKGGNSDLGIIFSLDHDGTGFKKVHDFDGNNGSTPIGNLIESSGKLIGTTTAGGSSGSEGVLFSLNNDGSGYTKLHEFRDGGRTPYSGLLTFGSKLFGVTFYGGSSGNGLIYSIESDGTDFSEVYDFDNINGSFPLGSFTESGGKLWATTRYGGNEGMGTVFSVQKDGSGFKTEHHFGGTDGSQPFGNLIEINNKLWGTTSVGGVHEHGTLFNLNLDGTGFSKVHDFQEPDGRTPTIQVTECNGKVWGMTNSGGSEGWGIIYSINPDGTNHSIVHEFNESNGAFPIGSLIKKDQSFYGMTSRGGSHNLGVIFTYNAISDTFSKLHDFDGANGAEPSGDLLWYNGKFWGLTSEGGDANYGVVFSINDDGSGFEKHHDFSFNDGIRPFGTLVAYNNRLWGYTWGGGSIIFSVDRDGNDFTKLVDLTIGLKPFYGSLYVQNGNLPILTSSGSKYIEENFSGLTYVITADEVASFQLGENKDESYFSLINGNEITFNDVPDFESPLDLNLDNVYHLDVIAEDLSGNVTTTEVSIHITDLDEEPPTFTSGNTVQLVENTTGVIYHAMADEEVIFTFGTSKDEGLFQIVNDAEIGFLSSPDFEAPQDGNGDNQYLIDLTATDEVGNESSIEITITVTDIDEIAPSFTSALRAELIENTSGWVFHLTADETVAFSMGTDLDETQFTLTGNEIRFIDLPDAESPDDENGDNIYELEVTATDSQGNSTTIVLAITVIDTLDSTKLFGVGTFEHGAFFSLDDDGTNPQQLVNVFSGQNPEYTELEEAQGRIWGMTRIGGAIGEGIIFSSLPDGTDYRIEHSFDRTNGGRPHGSLLYSSGKLWGMTERGGSRFNGLIFSIETDGSSYSVVHSFDNVEGESPLGSLIEYAGKLWGMTSEGGMHDQGTIFSINSDGTGFTKIYDFSGTDGMEAVGALSVVGGKLWGMTKNGGIHGDGGIFSINFDGSGFEKAHDFTSTTGKNPHGALIESNGKLWGTAKQGGASNHGVIFRLDLDGSSYSVVHDFDFSNGSNPTSTLIENNGKIWGTTRLGGTGPGVIFNLDTDGSNYNKIYEFSSSNEGSSPSGGLIEIGNRLLGLTRQGGNAVRGTIYSILNSGSGFMKLREFKNLSGTNPGKLVIHDGKLWGAMRFGGSMGHGTIFSMNPDGSGLSRLHDFDEVNGKNISETGGLFIKNDKMWGMTTHGGTGGFGVIFSMSLDGTGYTKLHEFSDDGNGGLPSGSLIDINGQLWGTTLIGGTFSEGLIFSIDPDGSNYTIKHHFDGLNGSSPRGDLTVFQDRLWGIAGEGGTADEGIIFSMAMDGSDFTKIHDFEGIGGSQPNGNLALIGGKMWGVTRAGGTSGNGTVFHINVDGSEFTKVYDFDGSLGRNPVGGLIENNGKIWGLTQFGGNRGIGIVFSILEDGTGFSKVLDLVRELGGTPRISLIGVDLTPPINTSPDLIQVAENQTGVTYQVTTNELASYNLGTEKDESLFNFLDGELSFSSSPDYEVPLDLNSDNFYLVDVIATDAAGNSTTLPITFEITDVDEIAPTITSSNSFSIEENITGVVYTATADESVTFSLGTSKDESVFSLSTDAISFVNAPDHESPEDGDSDNEYLIDLIAIDNAGNESSIEVAISVTDVDEIAPTITSSNSFSIEENITGVVYTATADESVTFSLGGTKDESLFSLSTGAISFVNAPDHESPEDADSDNEYLIDLIATDNAGNQSSIEVAISVTDVDEIAPAITSSNSFSIEENITGVVYTATADESVTFSLGGTKDESLFSLSTGAISFVNAPDHESPEDADSDNEYLIDLIATDNAGNESSIEVAISVTDIDEIAPTITSSNNLSIEENITGVIYTATADESVTFSLGGTKDESLFSLSTGAISFVNAPDHESPEDGDTDNEYLIDLIATDNAGNESSIEVAISVTDIDEIAPTITSSNNLSIEENITGVIYTATADESVTFSLGTSKDESVFSLSTDAISFVNAPDHESPEDGDSDNEYLIDLIATDNAGNESSIEVAISVTDIDEIAPTITSSNSLSIEENITGVIYTATADESVTFSLGGTKDESLFSLSTGAISFVNAPDHESPEDGDSDNEYLIDLIATDNAGNQSSIEVTISVTDVDEIAPTITSSNNLSIEENITGVIYTATADESVIFSLGTFKDESMFSLSTDAISFVNPPDHESPEDADSDNEYLIDLIATDNAGNQSSIEVAISVTDIDEIAPTITSSNSFSIEENITGVIYTATADESVTFSLGTFKDESMFSLSTGAISFVNAPDHESPEDADSDNEYLIDLIATDNAGNQSSIEVAISVTDIDEIAPTITSSNSLSIEENITGVVYTATADESVTFSLGGTKDESLFSLSTGAISFVNAPDHESPEDADSDNEYLIDLIATDNAGNESSIEVAISVTDIDEIAPTITSSNNLSIEENITGVIYTATADESVTFSLGGTKDESLFSLSTDAISFVNAPDHESPEDGDTDNEYLIDLIATDNAGNESSIEVAISVTDIDEIAPTITSSNNLSIEENITGVIYTATADESVTFSLGGTKDESLFSLSMDAISFVNAPDHESPEDGDSDNEYLIDLIATDNAGNESSIEVAISVTDVDEIAPTITSSNNLSIEENITGVIYTATADESVTFSLGTSKDESVFSLSTDAISFVNAPDHESPEDGDSDNEYLIDLIATDNAGNESSIEVAISVTDVDEIAPTITSSNSLSIEENITGVIYTATADESVTFSLGGTKDESLFSLSTGAISFVNAPDHESPEDGDSDNEYLIDLIATDNAGNESSIEVAISVTDVDEIAPTITSSNSLSIEENITGVVYTATANEFVTFSLGTSKDESVFSLSTDAISFVNAPDHESPEDGDSDNEYLIDLIATDNAGNQSSIEVTISVTDVDEEILDVKVKFPELSVYPNPVEKWLYVNSENQLLKIVLKDLTGRTILSTTKDKLDMEPFSSGIYLLEVRTKNIYMQVKVKKL